MGEVLLLLLQLTPQLVLATLQFEPLLFQFLLHFRLKAVLLLLELLFSLLDLATQFLFTTLQLKQMAVADGKQGEGIGSRLLSYAEAWARRGGYGMIILNARLGAESLWADWRAGRRGRLINLVLSGFLCGVLWEFWNYWARAKWIYSVPIMERLKIFEMPLPGYFGFPAFALECFTLYVFLRRLVTRGGRPIAL